MVRGLDVFSMWVKAERGTGEGRDDVLESLVDEEDALGVDERLDGELVARAVLDDEEDNALLLLGASEEAIPAFDRLLS